MIDFTKVFFSASVFKLYQL